MSHLLGIDLGERRIGLAIADTTSGRVEPFATVRRGPDPDSDAQTIRRAVGSLDIAELVVGLPLNMRHGDEGAQAVASRAWAETLGTLLGLPVVLRDERLSSHVAEERLGSMPRGRSGGPPTPHQRERYRARVDREAAAIILQDELDARTAERWSAPTTPEPAAAENTRDSGAVTSPTTGDRA